MGKAAIVSHLGAGKYSVKLVLHREHIAEKITDLTAQLIVLDASIEALDPTADGYKASLGKLTAIRLSCSKKKAYLKDPLHVPIDPTLEAWCADLSTALAGDVGTIEIPGERGAVLIQPGYGGNAVYDDERDGQLQPTVGSRSASATFYNMAILPGWQKWMPTYRFGTITGITEPPVSCDIDLDAAISSAQSLGVNQATTLSDVPFEYMSFDGTIFSVGDEVVIEFQGQDWSRPQVVGFKHNPRGGFEFVFKLTRGDGLLLDTSTPPSFSLYNSSRNYVDTTDPVYDESTECWSFSLADPEDADPLGYFVFYDVENGIETQYPYRYKSVDQYQSVDLIPFAAYEDTIPYYKVLSAPAWTTDPLFYRFYHSTYQTLGNPVTASYSRRIASSVPIAVKFGFRIEDVGVWIAGLYGPISGSGNPYNGVVVTSGGVSATRHDGDTNGENYTSEQGFSLTGQDYGFTITMTVIGSILRYYGEAWVWFDCTLLAWDSNSVWNLVYCY